jgi:1-acyl-sn-glycerol-3-phosphate acyltransferase
VDKQSSGMTFLRLGHLFVLWFWLILSTSVGLCIAVFNFLVLRTVSWTLGKIWSEALLFVAGVSVEVHGEENVDRKKQYVYVCNHQSALDILILYAKLPHTLSFVAKKELFSIPLIGWGLFITRHVWIDRKNARKARQSIDRAIAITNKYKLSLLLFPEGTRSADGRLGEFKTGSLAFAILSGRPVVPVAIKNAYTVLRKKSFYLTPGTVQMEIGKPIDCSEMKTRDKKELAARLHEEIEQMLIRK